MNNDKINYDLGKTNKEDYFEGILPEINKNISKNNGFYEDEHFKPNISSVCNKNNPFLKYLYGKDKTEFKDILNKEKMKDYNNDLEEFQRDIERKNLKWKRLSSILKNKEIFKNDNIPISQGYLGDCYALAFLRGLQKFQTKRYFALFGACYPEIGYYEIYFFIKQNGEAKNIKVFVDDYLLVNEDNMPIFAYLKDKDKYVLGRNLLIEKALAKMSGCYFNIRGKYRQFSESYILTGYGLNRLVKNEKWPDDTFDFFVRQLAAKNIITCGSKEKTKIRGIYGNHRYLMLDALQRGVYNYFIVYQGSLNVIKLSNPWGYNGLEDMKNFKLNLDYNFINGEDSIKKYNIKNCDNGNLEITENHLKENFDQIYYCEFKTIEKKENENIGDKGGNGEKPEDPGNESIDERTINNLYKKRILMFDAIGVPKNLQENFRIKYQYDIDEGLFQFFIACLNFGTSLATFEKFMGIQPNQQSSLFGSLFSYSYTSSYSQNYHN